MGKIRFPQAEETRKALTKQQEKNIIKLYSDLAKQIEKDANKLADRNNISSILKKQYLEDMSKDVVAQLKSYGKTIEVDIKKSMLDTSQKMVYENNMWLKGVGVDIIGAYSHVPKEIVESIVTGQVYSGKWSLSQAIWNDVKKDSQDIRNIVAMGVAANKSTYEIAKDLEKYVNPLAKKEWDWSRVYPGTKRKIEYNAQRLARTMIGHAYQESFVRTTYNNPFFDAYQWIASNSERTCQLCMDRAGNDSFGLGVGIFPKDQLPMDHPNGMCTFVVVTSSSHEQIVDRIANWHNKPEGTYPELDKFASDLRYTSKVEKAKPTVVPTTEK